MEMASLIKSLSPSELQELKTLLLQNDIDAATNSAEDVEKHAVNQISCPHCQSNRIFKNGHVRGVQRYRCHGCQKTFSLRTNTPLNKTRKPVEVWSAYIDLLFEQKSLRHIANKLEISLTTSFYWRHKILGSLKEFIQQSNPMMRGIVEADETYLPLSYKGQKSHLPRPAKKRGSSARKRGISKEQVCVLVTSDRYKCSRMAAICLGRPSSKDISEYLDEKIHQNSVLVTDKHRSYISFCKKHNIPHKRLSYSYQIKGHHHIQTVNSLHSHLKRYLQPYQGVATKYLDNYLSLFEWARRKRAVLSQTLRVASPHNTYRDIRLSKMRLT